MVNEKLHIKSLRQMMALGGGHYEGEEQNVDQSTHVGVLQEESEPNGWANDDYCVTYCVQCCM